ncbi:TetR family transcriptional regulator [Rhodococcus sp. ABRD24]|uniref:TetR/AcrR family transcriptional regulator n=1 Tax=Rhodococcus sp. ABRD24 TaxID=2507582 RepID=UPI0013F17CE7|nr:TetR family transcriptional regulator [Rhodococcus sp. ABRD24]
MDRRALIADAAIDVIAEAGARSLTHRAIDRRLGLPLGSTSYYFRTRRDLIGVVVDRIHLQSKEDFAKSGLVPVAASCVADVVEGVAKSLEQTIAGRRKQLLARCALMVELVDDPPLRMRLMVSLFSREKAVALFTVLGAGDPSRLASGFVQLLEGLVLDHIVGYRTPPADSDLCDIAAELAVPIEAYLVGAVSMGAG